MLMLASFDPQWPVLMSTVFGFEQGIGKLKPPSMSLRGKPTVIGSK
jgi:hypothetical protein